MCDFKPGDEVVCVDASVFPGLHWFPGSEPREGHVYTVSRVVLDPLDGEPCLWLVGLRNNGLGVPGFYAARRFRKVQKRNDRLTIEAFSVIKDGCFEEPKRAPAKKRERA